MSGTTGRNTCVPWTSALIQEYQQAMTLCFKEALRHGYTLYIRPHLDDGTAQGAWRNGLLFKPKDKYDGFSYYDIMLAPLADALRDALKQTAEEGSLKGKPELYFATQGEMSATIMRFSREWGSMTEELRARVGGGLGLADVKIGVGLNFNRLDDTTSISKTYGSSRMSWLMWSIDAEGEAGNAPEIDAVSLRQLFNQQLDFVGISAYAPFSGPGLSLNEFENSAFTFGEAMAEYGIDLKGLINAGKLDLQYSEFGIGGGNSYAGTTAAKTPGEVALRPFFGVYGAYNPATDPWQVPANRAFLREYYSKAVQWLAAPEKTTYRVSTVFIWSMASWDVLGIYPESSNALGSYQDDVIVKLVREHNTAVLAGRKAGGAVAVEKVVVPAALPSAAEEVSAAAGK